MSEAVDDTIQIVYFTNTDARDHTRIYGKGAFFDLKTEGKYASQAVGLPIGQECVVASYADNARSTVKFEWHSLEAERRRNDDRKRPHRVFFGDLIFSEVLNKEDAAGSLVYGVMFNVNGHFKRPPVANRRIESSLLPTRIQDRSNLFPDEVTFKKGSYREGAVRRVEVNAYERNPQARRDCIAHYKPKCVICKLDFGRTYGPEASGFIHVHHLKPLHELGESYQVDPIKDLRPVCPNCHAVLHLGGVNRSIQEVRRMLREAKGDL